MELESHEAQITELERASSHRFADWPDEAVPKFTAGVYTVWDVGQLIYVGMSGRGMSADNDTLPNKPLKPKGLWTRLNSHASGRRSGDQFCVYICDRFVVPSLTPAQLSDVKHARLSLDSLTRKWIGRRLSYRFVLVPDSDAAFALERAARKGGLQAGPPFLNPLTAPHARSTERPITRAE